ncbi:peptidase family M48-domain-containing protein [Jimgerdemannia flammicorona]|uniref:CAAX prenyl protease n=1 Tax=Jimgerdemannia flammicorona TaxID=994334 RepID=A0A433DGX8_9FUNG|nr:peptidase family M48-domain-containing protein [Jimgerdemannia flammicorona]
MTTPYKEYVLAFSYLVYAFDLYLSWRQYRKLQEKNRPKAVVDIVSQEDFDKAQAYGSDKARFGFVAGSYSQLETTVFILFGALPWLWDLSGTWMLRVGGYGPEYEITQSIIFYVLLSLLSTVSGLPVLLYSTFVIEERHGFNKQTAGLFFMDLLKGHLLGGAIGIPVLAAFLWIIKATGETFYFWVWVFIIAFQMFMITIYPTVIQPLFNKVTPLQEGDLKEAIEQLASRISFPLRQLYVIDGSKRSAHSNAYFYGFFKNKRIVLYDTLLEQAGTEEICAVLAHELGHWAQNHTIKMLVTIQLHLLLVFWQFSFFINNDAMYESFGFAARPTLIGFLLFQYIYSSAENLVAFLQNVYTRKNEYEADAYASKLGYNAQLRSALLKLHIENRNNLNVDPLYSAWNHSHPGLVERLTALEAEDKNMTSKGKEKEL